MKTFEATEQAYKNGYEQGYKDALAKDKNVLSKWIPVSERLPDVASTHKTPWDNYSESIRVLCACLQADGKRMVKEGYCKVYEGYEADPHWKIPGTIHSVTHWMPLPEPPKGERVMFGSIKLAKEIKAWQRSMEQEKKPMTNADRIRAMSDEELARYMAELIDNIDSQTCCYSNIPDEWLSWLQQPAEVE